MANENMREADLVLSPNEFAYVLDTTKGNVSCAVGPYKMSLSTTDRMVVFDEHTKSFRETNIEEAIQTFVTAPENWYVQLKNPTKDGSHPIKTTSNTLPDLDVGRKINIVGNVSFALYPGQMAKVIPGHRMHSNQYLKARVYDADAANLTLGVNAKDPDEDDTETVDIKSQYVCGQILIIKGSEIPFYIPPTGIEVLPINGVGNIYVRDALTLKKLEYCILEDETGKRSYIHGPDVVFPRPDQKFLKNSSGGNIFDAIELSEISGIYVKVIEEYEDCGTVHPIGEELFITGKDTPIYFPRQEHSIIDYDGMIVYHAIAIPKGEGRYIMNRLTGEIKTIEGPTMFLPDPRFEVVVKRYLTKEQCQLWYPGNEEVKRYNLGSEYVAYEDDVQEIPQRLVKSLSFSKGISRGTEYTPPRSIVFNNKFDGAVSISVYNGYAVNVISKDSTNMIVVGPQTILLDYDQTLDILDESVSSAKNRGSVDPQVYLCIKNNVITDRVQVKTSDFIEVDLGLSYYVDFLPEYQDRWFSIKNYVQYLHGHIRIILRDSIAKYSIEDFLEGSTEIIKDAIINTQNGEDFGPGLFFAANGMFVTDVDITTIGVRSDIRDIIMENQDKITRKDMYLTLSKRDLEIKEELAKIEKRKLELEEAEELAKKESDHKIRMSEVEFERAFIEFSGELDKYKRELELKEAEEVKEIISANIASDTLHSEFELDRERKEIELRNRERDNWTNQIMGIMSTITPDLVAAMTDSTNTRLVESITDNLSPYALAERTDTVEILNRIVHGTPLEESLKGIMTQINNVGNIEE